MYEKRRKRKKKGLFETQYFRTFFTVSKSTVFFSAAYYVIKHLEHSAAMMASQPVHSFVSLKVRAMQKDLTEHYCSSL